MRCRPGMSCIGDRLAGYRDIIPVRYYPASIKRLVFCEKERFVVVAAALAEAGGQFNFRVAGVLPIHVSSHLEELPEVLAETNYLARRAIHDYRPHLMYVHISILVPWGFRKWRPTIAYKLWI